MRYPSIDKLLEKVESKYKLAYIAAKRAKQIESGDEIRVVKPISNKKVGCALEEILEDKIEFEFKKP